MKKYKKLLPVLDDSKVITQFGFLPLSVLEPSKEHKNKYSFAYYEQDENVTRRSRAAGYLPGLKYSEFHSELCENIIKYWSLKNSKIVDPFAGRGTRAVISSYYNREYYGYEISPITYNNNLNHFKSVNDKLKIKPVLYLDDGCLLKQTSDESMDFCFSCPPYHYIENYESVENQLSDIKTYKEFLERINECGKNVYRTLKPGTFFCWVVGDWRDDKGEFRSFSTDSINMFKDIGFRHHDTIIVKNQSPFAALQAGKCATKRITSKIHEWLLVFKKNGEYEIPDNCSLDDINENVNKFFN
jgi:DNA modification methylase